jgi:predicted dehydrogenase
MEQKVKKKIRWGILSTGYIAHQFAEGLTVLPDAQIAAVGSRNADTAVEFAARYDIPRGYANYEELVRDPDIDVVYIGTPHSFHKENTLLCLSAGKPVLCEKPLTMNAADAEAVVITAREQKLFVMEAMWSRFLPALVKAKQMIDDGVIGDLQIVASDFGFAAPFDPKSRLYDPELGGGALLDIGIYPVSLASMILGPPDRITSMAQFGPTKVDEQTAMIDGCSHIGLIRIVTLPLIAPGLVVTALFCFIWSWNDFMFALILTRNQAITIPVAIASMREVHGLAWNNVAATAALGTIPMIVFAVLMQKYLVRGLSLGSVK